MRAAVVDHDYSEACGVRDLGARMARRLGIEHVTTNNPGPLVGYDVLFFNYNQPSIMPWAVPALPSIHGMKVAVLHDYTTSTFEAEAARRLAEGYDRVVVLDPDIESHDPRVIVAGRFLPERVTSQPLPDDEIRIGSFGFAMPHKGFAKVAAECVRLAATIDRPVVYRLHAPAAHFVAASDVLSQCLAVLEGSPVRFEFTNNHRPEDSVVRWLAGNHVNCLLYDVAPGVAYSGLSGALDYLLAARRPILVSDSPMLRQHQGSAAVWPEADLAFAVLDNTRVTAVADRYDATAGDLLEALL